MPLSSICLNNVKGKREKNGISPLKRFSGQKSQDTWREPATGADGASLSP